MMFDQVQRKTEEALAKHGRVTQSKAREASKCAAPKKPVMPNPLVDPLARPMAAAGIGPYSEESMCAEHDKRVTSGANEAPENPVKVVKTLPPDPNRTIVCGVSLTVPVHTLLKKYAKENKTTIKVEALKAIRRGLA